PARSVLRDTVNAPDGIDPNARTRPATVRMLALLITMTAIGPLSLNILMPAVPGLAATLAADPATVQLTLSLFLLGLAASQLVVGPLSDRFGRRPVVLAGLAVPVVSRVAVIEAGSIAALVVSRAGQALG